MSKRKFSFPSFLLTILALFASFAMILSSVEPTADDIKTGLVSYATLRTSITNAGHQMINFTTTAGTYMDLSHVGLGNNIAYYIYEGGLTTTTYTPYTFLAESVVVDGNLVVKTNHGLAQGSIITITATNGPRPLVMGKTYYVQVLNTSNFRVSSIYDYSNEIITNAGYGLIYINSYRTSYSVNAARGYAAPFEVYMANTNFGYYSTGTLIYTSITNIESFYLKRRMPYIIVVSNELTNCVPIVTNTGAVKVRFLVK